LGLWLGGAGLQASRNILSAKNAHDLNGLVFYAIVDGVYATDRPSVAFTNMVNSWILVRGFTDFIKTPDQSVQILVGLRNAESLHTVPVNASQICFGFIAELTTCL
jgi:hypothetical protein